MCKTEKTVDFVMSEMRSVMSEIEKKLLTTKSSLRHLMNVIT